MPLLSSTPVTTTTGTTTTSTRLQSPSSAPLPSTAVAAATPRSAASQTGTNALPLHTVFNTFSMTDALHLHDTDRNRDRDRDRDLDLDLDRDLDAAVAINSYSEASARESKRLSANSEGSGPAPGSIFPASALALAFADTTTTTPPATTTATATATVPLSSSDNTFTNYNTMAFHNGYTTAATAHRSSFDYGLGLGQGLGQAGSRIGANVHGHGLNDIRKSPPFATAFADFKQPFPDATSGSNIMNPPATAPAAAAAAAIPNDAATAFLKPPPFTASGTSTSAMSGFENPISPLTPQKGTFSNEMQHAASLSMTDTNTNSKPSSPLMNMQDYTHRQVSPSRLSHSSSNSMGMLTNIDEAVLDSNGSFGSAPLPLEKVRTKSVFDDVWNGTTVSKDANVNTKTFIGDVPKTVPHESIWCSPPQTHAAPLRRFSYDAATASTFIPQNVQAFDPFDFSAFAKNLGSVPNNGNYPLNSLSNANGLNSFAYPQQQQLQQQQYSNNSFVGNNTRHASLAGTGSSLQQFVNGSHYNNFNGAMTANQYNSFGNAQTNRPLSSYGMNSNINTNVANHNLMSVDMDFKPTDEHIAHCLAQVAAYLGFPSAEILDIERYLGHLNNHALPHLATPSDPNLGANYEIVACCFKNARIDVFYVSMHDKQRHLQNLKVGDLVIVEADRGRDLGKVVKLNISTLEVRLLRYAQYIGRKAALSKDDDMHKRPILNFPKPVQRYAKNEELITIDSKIADEMNAIEVCQGKVRDFGLNMIIVDAEYQWDMKKMTFYYNSDARIDFRDLVKELFRVYKIRIWMSKKRDIC